MLTWDIVRSDDNRIKVHDLTSLAQAQRVWVALGDKEYRIVCRKN